MSDKEIEALEQELANLQVEFNRRVNQITRKLQFIRQRKQNTAHSETEDMEEVFEDAQEEQESTGLIRKGDWVKIINNYRYREKGVIGKVYKFNKSADRLWLRDTQDISYQQAPWNVTKLSKLHVNINE